MEKQNRYIYHYCAAQGNATVSGIAKLTFRIVSQEDLNTLKQIVSDDLSFQAVAIVSLSYLGRENEEIARPAPADDLAELVPVAIPKNVFNVIYDECGGFVETNANAQHIWEYCRAAILHNIEEAK